MACVFYIPIRFIVTTFTFVGFMVMLYLRANLSIAIVDMTSNRTISLGNSTYIKEPEFIWTTFQQGVIISAFNYGYLFAPPGGMLAARYGGATVFGLGVLITGCLTVLTPVFCRVNLFVFILTRMVEGIFEAFSTAATAVIFAHWAPPDERARLISISIAGAYLGTSLNYPISGYIAKAFGWEAVFYISGAISIAWYLLWISFVTNDPSKHRSIREDERVYLKRTIQFVDKKKISYPWKKIFTSKAVWALFIHRFANSWASVFVLLCLPMYFKGLFQMDIANIGILSSIPNFCTLATQPFAAVLFDYLRNEKYLSSTGVHKVFTCTSYLISAAILLRVSKCTSYIEALTYFTLLRLSSTHGETSYYTLSVDLSPQYSGLLNGVGTAFYSMGSLLSPMVLGYIVSDLSDRALWNIYFALLSSIFVVSSVMFFFLGSGNVQTWEEGPTFRKSEIEEQNYNDDDTIQ